MINIEINKSGYKMFISSEDTEQTLSTVDAC